MMIAECVSVVYDGVCEINLVVILSVRVTSLIVEVHCFHGNLFFPWLSAVWYERLYGTTMMMMTVHTILSTIFTHCLQYIVQHC